MFTYSFLVFLSIYQLGQILPICIYFPVGGLFLTTGRPTASRGGGNFHRNAIRGRAAQMGRFLTKNP